MAECSVWALLHPHSPSDSLALVSLNIWHLLWASFSLLLLCSRSLTQNLIYSVSSVWCVCVWKLEKCVNSVSYMRMGRVLTLTTPSDTHFCLPSNTDTQTHMTLPFPCHSAGDGTATEKLCDIKSVHLADAACMCVHIHLKEFLDAFIWTHAWINAH